MFNYIKRCSTFNQSGFVTSFLFFLPCRLRMDPCKLLSSDEDAISQNPRRWLLLTHACCGRTPRSGIMATYVDILKSEFPEIDSEVFDYITGERPAVPGTEPPSGGPEHRSVCLLAGAARG